MYTIARLKQKQWEWSQKNKLMSFEQSLRRSVINTLAYFDLADYPLTKEELFYWLWQPPTASRTDLINNLPGFNLASKSDYYFLPGREKVVEERLRRSLISEQKLLIARRAIKIIRSVPFLRAVFVCNSVGAGQADKDSDIDFFIVTEKNRIWITRLFITFLLSLFRLRRVGKKINNKICLSFYVTADNLDLAKWRVADDDIHFAYWLNQMLPIFDPENYYGKFLEANSWTRAYLPNIDIKKISTYADKIGESGIGRVWKNAWEKMWQGSYGDLINNQAKQIQLSKMKHSGKPLDRGEDKGVVISDGVLKFHEKDTRIDYRDKWKQKIQAYDFEKNT